MAPMRIHILSDLHLERAPFDPPETNADLVVLAGDTHNGAAGIEWARQSFSAPVLFVSGNHEPFDAEFFAVAEGIRAAATGSQVEILDCSERIIGGVRFLGCTLWSDFELLGEAGKATAIAYALARVPDFRIIGWRERVFSPGDWIELHRQHRNWLEERLAEPFPGQTVVITHHAPHAASIVPKYASHPMNPAFVSDLGHLMGRAALWIHGHTHHAFDYTLSGTRVVCNPRGYPDEPTGFRDDFVIAI